MRNILLFLLIFVTNMSFGQNINIMDIDKDCAIVKADSAYCLLIMTDKKPYSIPCSVFLGDNYCDAIRTITNIELIRQHMPAEDTYIIHDRFGDITIFNRNDTLFIDQIGSIGSAFLDKYRLDEILYKVSHN